MNRVNKTDRQQDQDIEDLRGELQALREKVDQLQGGRPSNLYAAACGDYKILVVLIVFGGGFSLLVGGGVLTIFGIISLADLKEFFGIAKSSIPVLPTDATP